MLIILTLPFVAHIKMSAARDIFRRHFLQHPENIPLAVGALFGGLYGVYSLCRLARNHHTSWNRGANPEPWHDAKDKRFLAERPSLATERYKDI